MYSITTFPAVKIVEHKGILFEETETGLLFHGKIGGVMLNFSVFGSIKTLIKGYGIKPNDFMTITAEVAVYKNKANKIDESYIVLSAIPVLGAEKAVWPTTFFPSLRLCSIQEGEAKTGKYYRIDAREINTRGGNSPLRRITAWTGGSAELVEKMKLREDSEISAVVSTRYSIGPDGKKIDYTLLSFEYLNRGKKVKAEENQKPQPILEPVNEPAYEEVIDMPEEPVQKAPVKVDFNVDDFEKMFA